MKFMNGNTQTEETEPSQLSRYIGEQAKIHGSIHKIRKMSGFAFILLRTRETVVQCVYSPEFSRFPLETLREEMCIEASALIVGEPRSKSGIELRLTDLRILSRPLEELPVVICQKEVDASLETLLDYRPITLRNEKERAVFRIQESLASGMREYLMISGFTEIHTPKIVYAGAEGGANIFRLDYFGREAYLAQSPQFYKQMMVGVFERVFEIGPVFRAEKHDTSRHLNEYTGVDFEMGFIHSFEEIMQTETAMIRHALEYLTQHAGEALNLLKITLPVVNEIPAVCFHDAKQMIAEQYHREITDLEDFEPEEEKLLSELIYRQTGSEFVFVTHYPTVKRPFYAMEDPENPDVTLSFDLLFRGLEITTGGQRIHCYDEQVQKMVQRGMNPDEFESYLMTHKYGMPPHGGLGIGLERFTAKLAGKDNVRRASLFPRDTHRVTP